MAVLKSDLKFYLTGSEPLIEQTSGSQSIGGYPSTTLFNPSSLLTSSLNIATSSFNTTTQLESSYGVLLHDEFMKVSSNANKHLVVTREAFDTDGRYHSTGDIVYGVNKAFFNNSFNSDNKQYRCIAVTNCGSGIFLDLKFYLKFASRNSSSSVKLGVEIPSTEIYSGTSTGGSSISLVDTRLRNAFSTERDGTILTITSGSNINVSRSIATFDSATGIFTFIKAFPYPIISGISYRLANAPAQRTISGMVAPGSTRFSGFTSASDLASAVPINVNPGRVNINSLSPNETVYVWFERTITENQNSYTDNRVVLAASYRV